MHRAYQVMMLVLVDVVEGMGDGDAGRSSSSSTVSRP
jgi:hypothetical protein